MYVYLTMQISENTLIVILLMCHPRLSISILSGEKLCFSSRFESLSNLGCSLQLILYCHYPANIILPNIGHNNVYNC